MGCISVRGRIGQVVVAVVMVKGDVRERRRVLFDGRCAMQEGN